MSRSGWLVVVAVAGCSSPTRPAQTGDGAPAVDAAPVPDAPPPPPDAGGPFFDFPTDPIVDPGLPDGVAGWFAGGAASGGPCLAEPEPNTLYPRDWLRPRMSWVGAGDQNLFELIVTTPTEANPLTVITTSPSWTMPAAMWAGLSTHVVDEPIQIEIHGATWDGTQLTSGPALGAMETVRIAPVRADDAIVYWSSAGGSSLVGFHIGDEGVSQIVGADTASGQCVGCHTGTPDGVYLGFVHMFPDGTTSQRFMSTDGTGASPPFYTPAAEAILDNGNDVPAFSLQHFTSGDRVAVGSFDRIDEEDFLLTWTDLETTTVAGWGVLPRTGELRMAFEPMFANTTDTLVFAAATSAPGSSIEFVDGDIVTMPFANRAGGAAVPLPGASTAEYNEFYPAFSPDDRYIAYARAPAGQSAYDDPLDELFVIPAAGGDPVRLAANDPVQCASGAPPTSPGITNSWPRWAPTASVHGGKTYYWLTFSSTRRPSPDAAPQIFIAPLVDDGAGNLQLYPALYPWNQPPDEHHHMPVWSSFALVSQ